VGVLVPPGLRRGAVLFVFFDLFPNSITVGAESSASDATRAAANSAASAATAAPGSCFSLSATTTRFAPSPVISSVAMITFFSFNRVLYLASPAVTVSTCSGEPVTKNSR
jgi:hypothetical protein